MGDLLPIKVDRIHGWETWRNNNITHYLYVIVQVYAGMWSFLIMCVLFSYSNNQKKLRLIVSTVTLTIHDFGGGATGGKTCVLIEKVGQTSRKVLGIYNNFYAFYHEYCAFSPEISLKKGICDKRSIKEAKFKAMKILDLKTLFSKSWSKCMSIAILHMGSSRLRAPLRYEFPLINLISDCEERLSISRRLFITRCSVARSIHHGCFQTISSIVHHLVGLIFSTISYITLLNVTSKAFQLWSRMKITIYSPMGHGYVESSLLTGYCHFSRGPVHVMEISNKPNGDNAWSRLKHPCWMDLATEHRV